MVFQDKYELLAPLDAPGELALAGREIRTGQPVMVHLLLGRQRPEVQEALRRLNSLRDEQRRHVLETGDYRGIPFVVTDGAPGASDMQSWLESIEAASSREMVAPTGEFTQLFLRPAPDAELAGAETPSAKPAGTGEFTRLFLVPRTR